MNRSLILVAVLGVASGAKVLAPAGHRFKSMETGNKQMGNSCASLAACETCTGISFCMWHKDGYCDSEAHVAGKEIYNYFQGSCSKRAGDWLEIGAGMEQAGSSNSAATNAEAAAIVAASNHGGDDTYQYQPLMMQPPAIASQDEDHIFQGPFPRPDYGMGELGYKLQGIHMNHQGDESNTPRHQCPGNPLNGCLEKPVIVPQGGVHYDDVESRGEFNGHPVSTAKRGKHNGFKQIPHERSMASLNGFTKPKWKDQYDDKDDIDK